MKDRTILLTGATRGIGRALLEQLAPHNRVIVLGRDPHALEVLRESYPHLATLTADLAVPAQVAGAIDSISAQWPTLSVIINNAAVQHAIDFPTAPCNGNWQQELQVNLHAPIQLIEGLLPLLLRQPDARIVNITSILALTAKSSSPVYCASKAALRLFTQALRHQLRHTAVRVVEAVPPLTATSLGGDPTQNAPTKNKAVAAAWVAAQLLNQFSGSRSEIAIGKARIARWLYRYAPGLLSRITLKG